MTRLEKFLINRGFLETFKRNYRNYHTTKSFVDFLKNVGTSERAIDMAFGWHRTPEGHSFWGAVDEDWKRCLKNNKL